MTALRRKQGLAWATACAAVASRTTCSFSIAPATTSKRRFSLANNPNHLWEVTSLRNDFCALRHGQSMANMAKIISSHPEIATRQHGLSPVGREQAQEAGRQLVQYYAAHDYDGIVILTSDYLRAKETAQCVADAVQEASLPCKDVIVETRLRERWFGDWDGGSDMHYQDVWNDDALDPSHTVANVESVNSVLDRTTTCVLEWDPKFSNQLVLLVAHGDVLQITQTAFLKKDGSLHRTLEHLETATLRPLALKCT